MKQGKYIVTANGSEIIDTTIQAEIRASQAEYLERRYKRLQKRHQKKRNGLLWEIACFCGII